MTHTININDETLSLLYSALYCLKDTNRAYAMSDRNPEFMKLKKEKQNTLIDDFVKTLPVS